MWGDETFDQCVPPPSVVFLVKFEGPQRAAGGLEQHSAVLRSTSCIRQWAALQKQRLWLSGQKPVPVISPKTNLLSYLDGILLKYA